MSANWKQAALFTYKPPLRQPFRLCVNDYVRIDGKLGRVIRVTESAAVVLVNRPPRQFTTRFDKPVRLRRPPVIVRIAANSEIQILNRSLQRRARRRERRRR